MKVLRVYYIYKLSRLAVVDADQYVNHNEITCMVMVTTNEYMSSMLLVICSHIARYRNDLPHCASGSIKCYNFCKLMNVESPDFKVRVMYSNQWQWDLNGIFQTLIPLVNAGFTVWLGYHRNW